MTEPLAHLYRKLCRELSQAEHSADLHPTREARRLGPVPPADAFRAIAAHARAVWPGLEAAMGPGHKLDRLAGELVGKLFSISRHLLLDRLTDVHRSYRGTLLGLQHGIDCARLLREVAARHGQPAVAAWCDAMLAGRVPLVAQAAAELAWFADHPVVALRRSS